MAWQKGESSQEIHFAIGQIPFTKRTAVMGKEQTMKGFDNNEMSVRTLQNLKNSLDNRIHEIYNQGYREGYKDGVKDAMQKIADNILSEVADDE